MPDLVQTMFAYRNPPWHSKGKVVDQVLTAEEAIVAAGQDWEVALHDAEVAGVPIPGRFAIIRQDVLKEQGSMRKAIEAGACFGVVGKKYVPVQNRDLFGFFDPVVSREEGAFYHTGGVLMNGERVWLLAKVPGDFYVPGVPDDLIENYILMAAGHDGLLPIIIQHTMVRVVCHNTLSMALWENRSRVTIRHTASAQEKLAVAHKFFGLATQRASLFEQAAEKLLSYKVTPKFLDGFLKTVLPSPAEELGEDLSARTANQRERVELLFHGADYNNMVGMPGTGWSLYNAWTEFIDHDAPKHQATDRVNRNWFGSGRDRKMLAFKLLMEATGGDWPEA